MQVVFETVCFFIYADPRASCPVFESENQKPKQEDKTVKYTPKKVFILEEGKYIEMPYEEFNRRKQEDESYQSQADRHEDGTRKILREICPDGTACMRRMQNTVPQVHLDG